jgi:hypothetical protein
MRPLALSLLVVACAHAAPPRAPAPPAAPLPSPPTMTSLFDGASLAGWEGDPAIWSVREGAIDGVAEHGGQLIYTKGDYQSFRMTLQSRLASETNHLGVCFWGDRVSDFGYGQCILVIPPSGGMWDYHPGKKGPPREKLPHPNFDPHVWHTTEILANFQTGRVRMAVNGVEVTRYQDIDQTRLHKGPIGLQIHAGASEVQYKDLMIEVDPRDDRLFTVK